MKFFGITTFWYLQKRFIEQNFEQCKMDLSGTGHKQIINKYQHVQLKTIIKKNNVFIIIAYSELVRKMHIIFTNKNPPAHWGKGISIRTQNLTYLPNFTIFLAKIVLIRSQDFDSIFIFSAFFITPSHQKITTIGIQSIF